MDFHESVDKLNIAAAHLFAIFAPVFWWPHQMHFDSLFYNQPAFDIPELFNCLFVRSLFEGQKENGTISTSRFYAPKGTVYHHFQWIVSYSMGRNYSI